MYKTLYQQIKHVKVYVGRYGSTLLIKNADFINTNQLKNLNNSKNSKNSKNLKSKNKKITHVFKENKEHSYLPTSNPFLL